MAIKGTYPGKTITVENAAADIPQGSVINFAGGLAGGFTTLDNSGSPLGVSLDYAALTGEHFTVAIDGIVEILASGGGNAGDELITTTGGKVKVQDGTDPVIGYAMDDFTDGTLVRVKLI